MPAQKKAGSKRKLIGEQEIPGGQVRGSTETGKNRGLREQRQVILVLSRNALPLVEVARSAEADSGRCATQSVQKRKAVPVLRGLEQREQPVALLIRRRATQYTPARCVPSTSGRIIPLLVLLKVPQIKFCRFTAPPFFRKIPRRPGMRQRIHPYLRPAGSHSRIRRKRGTNATSFLVQIRVAYEELGAGLANFRAKQHQPQVLGCDTLASHFKTMGSHGKTRALTVQTVFQTLLHFS
jgi:hypothetical protein